MLLNIYGGKLSVTKIFSFCYGHRLPGYDGPCKNAHGHNSTMEIEVRPEAPSDYSGILVDFTKLKEIVNREIIDVLDHKFLNDDVEHFKEINPTAENMVIWIVSRLEDIFGDSLMRVRLYETPTSYAEWNSMER